MQSAQKRVEAGARLLDKQFPDWERNIDPDVLSISHARKCVLGQLFGNYCKGYVKLPMKPGHAVRFGFCPNTSGETEELNGVWIKLIASRLRHLLSGNGKPKSPVTRGKALGKSKGGTK